MGTSFRNQPTSHQWKSRKNNHWSRTRHDRARFCCYFNVILFTLSWWNFININSRSKQMFSILLEQRYLKTSESSPNWLSRTANLEFSQLSSKGVIETSPSKILEKMKETSPFKCAFDGERFASDSSGKPHESRQEPDINIGELISSEQKSLACSHCNKSFDTRKQLHNHRWKVKAPVRFQCTLCKIGFKDKLSYTCHERLHSG